MYTGSCSSIPSLQIPNPFHMKAVPILTMILPYKVLRTVKNKLITRTTYLINFLKVYFTTRFHYSLQINEPETAVYQ